MPGLFLPLQQKQKQKNQWPVENVLTQMEDTPATVGIKS